MAVPDNFQFELSSTGYFSLLGLDYGAELGVINKAYRRAALTCHPDHVANADHHLFQELQTAKAVLSNPESRLGYERILFLRTLLHQRDQVESQVDPWLVFALKKINRKNKVQDRILIVDLIAKTVSNYKKAELRKSFRFEQIINVRSIASNQFCITMESGGHTSHYLWECRTERTNRLLLDLFKAIHAGTVRHILNDAIMPERSYLKGKVSWRKYSARPLAVASWAERYVMIGASNILVFRDCDYAEMKDCIAIRDIVEGRDAGISVLPSRTLALFWRHDPTMIMRPTGMIGGDPALMLRFDTVSTCQAWTQILRRMITRTQYYSPSREHRLGAAAAHHPSPHTLPLPLHAAGSPILLQIEDHRDQPDGDSMTSTDSEQDNDLSHPVGDPDSVSLQRMDRMRHPNKIQSEVIPDQSQLVTMPTRAYSDLASVRTDEQVSTDDTASNVVLRLITIRDEISQHRRQLRELLQEEKQLMAARERQVIMAQGGPTSISRQGFLSDLADRIQGLFGHNQTDML